VSGDHTTAVFAAQLILLLLVGRMLGEGMSRLGQPAIFGQLLAGVVLGPSVFGALAPELRKEVFPDTPALRSMIDAVSQIGILLLLLLTGMETNLALIGRKRRAVISTSLTGIAVPFASGVLLAYALPDSLIPSPAARLVTALFLGTALSISSVKIVAVVLMEVGAIRRDLGQLILATAILDDTVAWILLAVIAGMAAHGTLSLSSAAASMVGTAVFLALSLTVGRRLVARVIRWCNDNLTIEVPVITAILLVMLTMALSTELLGVHSALGAFMAGILVGQSPILTEHIEGELRGFILAFFSPVFFAVAGLGMDLRTLLDPSLLLLTLAVIAVASAGKFLGALAGGRLGGLTGAEALALAMGLNARGSTEVIIASIGLSLGVLSTQLYTMVVAMAVVTTLVMPPTLRWILAWVPLREEEAKRLEKEEAEESQSVPRMERALVLADASANGRLAAWLAGLFAGGRGVMTTVLDAGEAREGGEACGRELLARAAASALERRAEEAGPAPPLTLGELVRGKPLDGEDTVEKEAAKGYSIAFVGIERPISATTGRLEGELRRLAESYDGPLAVVLNARSAGAGSRPLDILVPTGGTPEARLATEVALALARAGGGALTALHVFDPQDNTELLRGRARRQGLSILVEARRLGKGSGVDVKGLTMTHSRPEVAIERAARAGRYDLVVVGTSLRQGEAKFVGPRSAAILRALDCPVLLIAR